MAQAARTRFRLGVGPGVGLALALALAACSGPPEGGLASPEPDGTSGAASTAPDASSDDAWPFGGFDGGPSTGASDSETTEVTGPDDAGDGALPALGPDDVALPEAGVTEQLDELAAPTPDVDPCTLVTASEFTAWAGSLNDGPLALDHGEACGFIGDGDHVRMAIGAIGGAEAAGYLPPDPGTVTDVQADLAGATRVVWAPHHPIDASSSLVVEGPGRGLVVEMSGRGPWDEAALRDGALAFAALAWGRSS